MRLGIALTIPSAIQQVRRLSEAFVGTCSVVAFFLDSERKFDQYGDKPRKVVMSDQPTGLHNAQPLPIPGEPGRGGCASCTRSIDATIASKGLRRSLRRFFVFDASYHRDCENAQTQKTPHNKWRREGFERRG